MSVTNAAISLPVDGNVQVNVAVKPINGFTGAVTITSPGNSGDVNYGSPVTVAAGSSGNITMSATQTALLGDRSLVLKATSGSIEHDVPAKLTVVLKVGNGKVLGFAFENVSQADQTYLINLANQKWIPTLTALLGPPVSTFTLTIAGRTETRRTAPTTPMTHRVEMWVPSNPLWDDSVLLLSLIRAWTREVYYFLPPQVEWPILITAYQAGLANDGVDLVVWNNYFPAAGHTA